VFGNIKTLLLGKKYSNETAKNRLQMVLVQDRSGMTSKDMDFFKRDLMEVISKYFVVETKNLQVEWRRNDATTALVINTPVVGRTRGAAKLATAG
jgi:cell division topological specificity factor